VRALITGISGLAGGYLADRLMGEGFEVFGLDVIPPPKGHGSFVFRAGDVTDMGTVLGVMGQVRPDFIVHLASIGLTEKQRQMAEKVYATNIMGTLNVFEAVLRAGIDCRILVTGSSAAYGFTPEGENPIKESHLLRPINHYGTSKAAQDMLAYQYWKGFGLKVIRTRTFNNTAPGESPEFVCSGFAKQIAEMEKGLKKPVIQVGNLSSVRDFTDTRDVIEGYYLLLKEGIPGEAYNIGSGKGVSVEEILRILGGLSTVSFRIRRAKERMRAADVPVQIGDCSKIRDLTGWRSTIELRRTLGDILDYWRARV
jgi:GDP-4-dehydro-6-deoxy-D-mannose reductase